MNKHIKLLKKYSLRYKADPNEYNEKQLDKQVRRVLTEFTYKMDIDPPDDFINNKLIYGDLAIPFTRIIYNLEHNESPEGFWDYVDECLEKEQIERPKFTAWEKMKANNKAEVTFDELLSAISRIGGGYSHIINHRI